ncbi:MAG: hypothetical protein IJ398_04270 [Clostridia bacterium]|nr:hypothetical protein [Clostridia bacterium]
MTYQQLVDKQQKEVNEFPLGAAYNKKQFEEMMAKWNLKPTDTDQITTIMNGVFIRKSDIPAYIELVNKLHNETQEAIKNDETGEGFVYQMFAYELDNHEYSVTYDLEETLDALGYTIEDIQNDRKLSHGLKKALKRYR